MDKIMIIGVGWEQLPLLNKAKELDLEIVATTTWDKTEIEADEVYEVEPRNLNKLEEIFLSESPDAVIADECDYSMYAVAYLTDKYHLPGPGLKPLTITNNKQLQRDLITETDVLQPQYKLCWNYEMVNSAAEDLDFPVVVKPLDNRGSIGVEIVKKKEDLRSAWFKALASSHSRMCLVEEFIKGEIITFEGFYDSYKYNFLTVSTKDNYPGSDDVAKKLYFPGDLSEEVDNDSLIKQANEIINKIDLKFGFSHIEFMIEKGTNNIYFIEIANRGGGVHISNKILPNITGVDLNKKLLKLSLGEDVRLNLKNNEYKNNNLMYFIAPQGSNTPQKVKEKYQTNLLALYMKQSSNKSNLDTDNATDRSGVAILTGDRFDELNKVGEKIEQEIKALNEEYYWN